MIEFPFRIGQAFRAYKNRPITIPKKFYTQLRHGRILGHGRVRIVCPDGSAMKGDIHHSFAGYGSYYQLRVSPSGCETDSLMRLRIGERVLVRIHEDSDVVEILSASIH